MRPSFGARRKPRKIGEDEQDDSGKTPMGGLSDATSKPIRPSTASASSKSKKRSSLRVSFGPGGTSMTEDDESVVFTPKKSNLSRQAVEKNALRKALASSISSERGPYRQSDDRPSYSIDDLKELQSSTPTTPKDLKSISDAEDHEIKTLDLAAKFGTNLAMYNDAIIPTDAEIKEKKQRRARLAKEEFIALSDEDESNENSILSSKQKPETRLVRDDEEIAEGFDEFVEDGQIALGRKSEREQKRKHEAEMRQLIQEAEGSSGDDSDDSEAERKAAYEAAQTRAGMDGLQKDGGPNNDRPRRPRTPPKITPLPSLNTCLERLQATLSGIQYSRMQKVRRMEELQKEKSDIKAREEEIQRLLQEAGENYEKLRAEAGVEAGEKSIDNDGKVLTKEETPSRGLEHLGNGLTYW
ncbi:hypothetical protein MMC07_006998 [Pseudocyphellaria aurata]|nr:hypothetical protein [Pseudocyphellaria aurata]